MRVDGGVVVFDGFGVRAEIYTFDGSPLPEGELPGVDYRLDMDNSFGKPQAPGITPMETDTKPKKRKYNNYLEYFKVRSSSPSRLPSARDGW